VFDCAGTCAPGTSFGDYHFSIGLEYGAFFDDCDVCSEGESNHSSNSDIDECGICFGGGIPEGDCDCDGNVVDECDICGGDGSGCSDGGATGGGDDAGGGVGNEPNSLWLVDNGGSWGVGYNSDYDIGGFGGVQLSGYIEGNPVIVKIYKPSTNLEYETNITWSLGTGQFGDVIQAISELELVDSYACEDDNDAMAAFGGCAAAVAALPGGCDFVFEWCCCF
jgi:hypothetical protein